MSHFCHAEQCTAEVPPIMFMCKPHWYTLHKHLRGLVWRYYVPKQEINKNPSLEYQSVAGWSILYVLTIETHKAINNRTQSKNNLAIIEAHIDSRRSRDTRLCMLGCNKDLVLWLRDFYANEFPQYTQRIKGLQ